MCRGAVGGMVSSCLLSPGGLEAGGGHRTVWDDTRYRAGVAACYYRNKRIFKVMGFSTGRIKVGESLCFVGVLGSNAVVCWPRSVAALGVCGPPAGSATLAAAGSLPSRCATDQQPARPRRLPLLVSLACFCPLVWADVPPSRSSAICLVASPVPLPQRGVTGPILCAEPALRAPTPSRNGKGMWVMALLDPPYKAWLAVCALALGFEDLALFPLAQMVLLVPEDLSQPNLGIRCAGRTQTFTE